jgi:hypothetical protein
MKNLSFIPLITALCFVLQLFLPWWIIAVVAFAVCWLMKVSPGKAYAGSFGAVFSLWLGCAMVQDKLFFDTPMSDALGGVIGGIPGGYTYTITAFVGALVAGMAGMVGGQLYKVLNPS